MGSPWSRAERAPRDPFPVLARGDDPPAPPDLFERLVAEAWPAPYREQIGGWQLRYANGVTKRANSVLPLGDPGDEAVPAARRTLFTFADARSVAQGDDPLEPPDVRAAIDGAERFYAARNAPTVFSIGDGAYPGLDGLLAARGYALVDPTLVMTADIPFGTAVAHDAITIDDSPSPEWLDTWWSVDGRYPDQLDAARSILTGVAASYVQDPPGLAVGRGVPQGECYGIFCMAVVPHARRRGLGGAVLRALLADGRRHGARRAYLVVVERNTAARALYERAGFQIAGRYHYRVR